MKTIRYNIFETNSSSSHSITVSRSGNYVNDSLFPEPNSAEPVILLDGGNFGWGVDVFTDSNTKANYCAIDFAANDEPIKLILLQKVIEDMTGCNVVIDLDDFSHIDHQSIGTADDELMDYQDIKDFVFNPESELLIDNDNH
jgi:type IV secretory pathway VirB4 component